jgi:hypothetical protein
MIACNGRVKKTSMANRKHRHTCFDDARGVDCGLQLLELLLKFDLEVVQNNQGE